MSSRAAFVTYNDEGSKCYWYHPPRPPRRRERREKLEVQALLASLFPMPPDPGDPRDIADYDGRARVRAIIQLRNELRTKVYPACDWERPRNSNDDDPFDPVIDYEELKGKLMCVFNLRYGGQYGELLDYSWEAQAPFNWAPHDLVHATVAAQDERMQRFLAAGGDPPQPPPRIGYIEISDE